MADKKIGTVIHFYDKILVAIVKLSAPLKINDSIKFKHGDKEFTQTVNSIELEHKKIDSAKKRRGNRPKSHPAGQGKNRGFSGLNFAVTLSSRRPDIQIR